jgi:hypothetical protein
VERGNLEVGAGGRRGQPRVDTLAGTLVRRWPARSRQDRALLGSPAPPPPPVPKGYGTGAPPFLASPVLARAHVLARAPACRYRRLCRTLNRKDQNMAVTS